MAVLLDNGSYTFNEASGGASPGVRTGETHEYNVDIYRGREEVGHVQWGAVAVAAAVAVAVAIVVAGAREKSKEDERIGQS